jgi:hypothetical protein
VIECVFTLDYELYGDGTGSLRELVYEPAARLRHLFLNHGVRFVNFVEAAELQKIDQFATDPAIGLVKRQIREFFEDGFEIGLHLHPQWCNARYDRDRWILDSAEYNLSRLPRSRLTEIVDGSLDYLRGLVGVPGFSPLSFRAGNWLFQPTQPAANVLAERGIRIDSSLFKGGVLHDHGLDYRRSLANGPFWRFDTDVNIPDPTGALIEMPIFAQMVPFWRMATAKRMGFGNSLGDAGQNVVQKLNRVRDLLRLRYPRKLDFCRMTLGELTATMDAIVSETGPWSDSLQPVVAIGHTKDLVDLDTVESFLVYLKANHIPVSTLADVRPRVESRG